MVIAIKIIYQILIVSTTLDNGTLKSSRGKIRINTERNDIHIIMHYHYKFCYN